MKDCAYNLATLKLIAKQAFQPYEWAWDDEAHTTQISITGSHHRFRPEGKAQVATSYSSVVSQNLVAAANALPTLIVVITRLMDAIRHPEFDQKVALEKCEKLIAGLDEIDTVIMLDGSVQVRDD